MQFGVGLYALQLVSDNLPDFGTDTVVVILDHLCLLYTSDAADE